MELSALTDADVRKLRDMARRIGAGGGSQKPNHKRRRGKQSGGGGGGASGVLTYALVTTGAPGATLSGGKITPGSGLGTATLYEWGEGPDATRLVPQKDENDNEITKAIINLSFDGFDTGASSIPAIGFVDPDKDVFVIASFMNSRAWFGYDEQKPQALRHLAGTDTGWGGKQCDEA